MKKLLLIFLFIFSIQIVSAVTIKDINSIEIEPGKTGVINFDIENDHDFDVKDVSIFFDFSQDIPIAPFGSSSEIFIGKLDEGDEESESINIIASADAKLGLYKIPVLISYADNDGNHYEKTDVVSVLIVSTPIIDVFLEEPSFIVGDKADISVQVVNRGFSDIKFLSVQLLNSDFYDMVSSKEVYIGDLDSDDFDNADFSIKLNYPLSNNLKFPVKLTYYDSENKIYNKNFNLSVPVYSVSEAQQLGLISNTNYYWIFLVVSLIVVIFVIYRIRKKRRKR